MKNTYIINQDYFLEIIEDSTTVGFHTVVLRQGTPMQRQAPIILTWFAKLPLSEIVSRVPALLPVLTQALETGDTTALE